MELFVTKLDEENLMVLGYDWLHQHNPSIDWVETKIMFCNPETHKEPVEATNPTPRKMDIQLVSTKAMDRIRKEEGSATFLLTPSEMQRATPGQLKGRATLTTQLEDTLSGVPPEYHKFHDVFSGKKANTLALH